MCILHASFISTYRTKLVLRSHMFRTPVVAIIREL